MGNRWATTEEVATAAGITGSAVMKWAGKQVLPAYTVHYSGRRGRSARWPLHAPEQATWVREQLDAGLSFDEIREALANGEFKPRDAGSVTTTTTTAS
jgi:hypothetical protein